MRLTLKAPTPAAVVKAVVRVGGKVKATRTGTGLTAPIDLRGLPTGTYRVTVTVTLATGEHLTLTRMYRTCTKKAKHRR